jgi:hypothetical protein
VQLEWRKKLVSRSGSSFAVSELRGDGGRLYTYRKEPGDNVRVKERKRRRVKKHEITRHVEEK